MKTLSLRNFPAFAFLLCSVLPNAQGAESSAWYHSHAENGATNLWVDVLSPSHYLYFGNVVLDQVQEIWIHVRDPKLADAENELNVRLRDGTNGAEPATEITLYRESKDPTQFTVRLDAASAAASYFRKSAVQVEIPGLRGQRLAASYVSAARLRRMITRRLDAPGTHFWSPTVRLQHLTR